MWGAVSLLQLRAPLRPLGECIAVVSDSPSCKTEVEVRAWATSLNTSAADLLRLLTWDAMDLDNLVQTPAGTPILGGGVDACVYRAGVGDPEPLLTHAQGRFGCTVSQPDVLVLAAFAAQEQAGSPALPMSYGRRKGACTSVACTDCLPGVRVATDPTAAADPADPNEGWPALGFAPSEAAILGKPHTVTRDLSFAKLMDKVASRGAGELSTCIPEACKVDIGGIQCGGQLFSFDGFDCAAQEAQRCTLVGGVGRRGVVRCIARTYACCLDHACPSSLPAATHLQLS